MAKEKDVPILIQKANKLFQISPVTIPMEDGSGAKATLQHRVGSKGGVLTIVTAMAKLGLRDEYLKKQAELRKKWRSDSEAFATEDEMWLKQYKSQARGALTRASREVWEKLYEPLDLYPCATWVPSGDKDQGSVFCIWAMVRLSSRKLAVGTDKDYARYLWSIKKQTQPSADKNAQITRDTVEYLKMGHAGKDVSYFLGQALKGDLPHTPPPILGLEGPK